MGAGEFRYPCPCCGYLVFKELAANGICPICFWEDDVSQLRFMDMTGANRVSLIAGQENFAASGASERRVLRFTRRPRSWEKRDPDWRPVDRGLDAVDQPSGEEAVYPDDYTQLYYWRSTYWRRDAHA